MASKKEGFAIELDTLTPGVAKLTPEIRKAIRAIMYRYAPKAEAYMRTTAPWTDRTGLARMGLGAEPIADRSDVYAIVLYHTVEYGIWLEVRFNGTYAVIQPTVEQFGPQVMSGLERLLERMF